MLKKTFSEEHLHTRVKQIVVTLRQVEGSATVADVCRKLGITEQTFYRWKRKFAGVGVAELRRLRAQLRCV